MTKAILGYKKQMTQIYDQEGDVIPCTLIEVSDSYIIGKRTVEKHGYSALVIGIGKKKKSKKVEKPKYKKLGFVPLKVVEVRTEFDNKDDIKVGNEVSLDDFKVGDKVDVTGDSKGKGFQGVVKRWGFKGGPRTHGQSDRERAPGSIGGGTDPGRVYKGKKMPGHMGNKTKTVLNLELVKVDKDNKVIFVKGSVPGSVNTILKIVKRN